MPGKVYLLDVKSGARELWKEFLPADAAGVAPFAGIRITPDGKLTPCPYVPTAAGDLRRESFGDVWRTASLFHELRTAALGGKCGRCEYREMCGGCRARSDSAITVST